MKTYAGIGSRETPVDIQNLMTRVAIALANDNWVLRSGGAEGADEAFEQGAKYKEIYLPWNGFNNKYADGKSYLLIPESAEVREFVYDYHPTGIYLKAGALKLMCRNTYQVLGEDLDSPAHAVVCWTSDGKASGGTGQALRIAKDYDIRIVNLYHPHQLDEWLDEINIKLA